VLYRVSPSLLSDICRAAFGKNRWQTRNWLAFAIVAVASMQTKALARSRSAWLRRNLANQEAGRGRCDGATSMDTTDNKKNHQEQNFQDFFLEKNRHCLRNVFYILQNVKYIVAL